ncbi:MAG: hypothetical protein IJX38_03615 [Clostridia bacterium]|nr:hypothetical protein [Clostridia bacterium]
MPIFFLKSITIRPLNAEELAELQGFQNERNKINPKPEKESNTKNERCYIPKSDVPGKVLLSKTCLKQLASLLLDVKMDEVEKFLYTLPVSVKEQLVPLIIEEYHRRCAKG